MSPIDAAIVRRKLGHIMSSLELLGPIREISLQEYRRRVWERKGVERDDYFGGFVKLGQLGILPEELAAALAPSAGLRNRLVHEYDTLDDAKVLAAVGTLLDLYPRYIQAIAAALVKLES